MGKRAVAKKNAKLKVADKRREDVATVTLNTIRVSPIKLNLVASMIRGMTVSNALVQLQFSSKRIANDVRKALQSGIANAENNQSFDVDSLIVKEAWVGKGIVMKRFHARARGRGARIFKPFSNLTIVLKKHEEAKGA
jgi:large subunit ribosomal protein L22